MKQLSDLDFNSVSRILGLPQATANGHPVIYEQMNAAIEGLAWKDDVVAASTANINLSAPGATIDDITMVSGDRFLAKNQTSQPENGVYIWNGAASTATRAADMSVSAEFNSAIVPVKAGTANAGTQWRCTTIDPTVGTTNIVFTSFGAAAPAASETTAGIAELATQSETDTGTDDLRIVTPLKLKSWSNAKKKFTANIGDGSATQYDVTHNFATRDVQVQVYRNGTPWDNVICDISRPDTNTVRFNFAAAPTANQFSVVILG